MAIGDDLSARLRAIPAPVQGALFMTAAALCFSVMNVFVRLATEEMAALEVVYRRLSEVGLGNRCLELHSDKAKKKEILEQLAESLNAAEARSDTDRDSVARELDRLPAAWARREAARRDSPPRFRKDRLVAASGMGSSAPR